MAKNKTHRCNRCELAKPLDEFCATKRFRVDAECKECRRVRRAAWAKLDKPKHRDRNNAIARRCYRKYADRDREKNRVASARRLVEFPEAYMLAQSRARAKRLRVEFTITCADITIPRRCPVLGLSLSKQSRGSSLWGNAPSLDRTDNRKGYIPGNVAVISRRANVIKNDGTADEHRHIARWMESQRV